MFLAYTYKLETSWFGGSSLSELGLSLLCLKIHKFYSLAVFLLLVISHNEPVKQYKLNRTNCNSLLQLF